MIASQAAALHLNAITLSLAARPLFPPLTASVAPGEVLTVMGPSGCGKSSLLAFIAGTLEPVFTAHGRVAIGDDILNPLPPEARRIGIQFQDDLLFPHLSVGENLLFALRVSPDCATRTQRRTRIEQALAEAGLAHYADRDPTTLSGGQRARVALIRTLLAAPRVLLLDEPFNKLDAALRNTFRQFVFEHARTAGLPTLLVTHDALDAAAAGGAVIEMGASD